MRREWVFFEEDSSPLAADGQKTYDKSGPERHEDLASTTRILPSSPTKNLFKARTLFSLLEFRFQSENVCMPVPLRCPVVSMSECVHIKEEIVYVNIIQIEFN
jgi:hypothetical protein